MHNTRFHPDYSRGCHSFSHYAGRQRQYLISRKQPFVCSSKVVFTDIRHGILPAAILRLCMTTLSTTVFFIAFNAIMPRLCRFVKSFLNFFKFFLSSDADIGSYGFDYGVVAVLSFIYNVHFLGILIFEHEEGMSQKIHLQNSLLCAHRLYLESLFLYNLKLGAVLTVGIILSAEQMQIIKCVTLYFFLKPSFVLANLTFYYINYFIGCRKHIYIGTFGSVNHACRINRCLYIFIILYRAYNNTSLCLVSEKFFKLGKLFLDMISHFFGYCDFSSNNVETHNISLNLSACVIAKPLTSHPQADETYEKTVVLPVSVIYIPPL